jgi:hypothetical protein
MLVDFEVLIDDGRYAIGFCHVLPDYYGTGLSSDCVIKKLYPELYAYKPEVNEDDKFWFLRSNRVKRLKILNEIITQIYAQLNLVERGYLRVLKCLNYKL